MRSLWYKGRYLAAALAVVFFIGYLPPKDTLGAEAGAETSASESQESSEADDGEWNKAIPVSKIEDLMDCYEKAEKTPVTIKLMQDIIINYPVEWKQTKNPVTVITGEKVDPKLVNRPPYYSLQVVKGGKLTIDNLKLKIKGPDQVIVVESEGSLILSNGEIQLYEDGREAVIIKQGGIYQNQGSGFQIKGTVRNDNTEIPDPTQPTVTEPETTQAPVTKPSEETICQLTTELISVDSQIAEIRISIPEVPHDTKEIYVYYSKNKEVWKKVYWLDDSVAGDPKEVENFVTEMQRVPPYMYIPYEHIFEEYGVQDKIYLKVQIIGPTRTGMSTVSELNFKDSSPSAAGSAGNLGSGSRYTYGGGSGFAGSYGSMGSNTGAGSIESSSADEGLPTIFLSRTAPYWASSQADETGLMTQSRNHEEENTPQMSDSQDEIETSPFEESSSLLEEYRREEGVLGNGGVQWGAGKPEAEAIQPYAEEEQKKSPAAVIILLGVLFLLIIGSVVWSRMRKKKN